MYTPRCIYIGYLFTFESPCVPDATQSTRTKDLASNYNLRKLLDGLKLVAEKEKKVKQITLSPAVLWQIHYTLQTGPYLLLMLGHTLPIQGAAELEGFERHRGEAHPSVRSVFWLARLTGIVFLGFPCSLEGWFWEVPEGR